MGFASSTHPTVLCRPQFVGSATLPTSAGTVACPTAAFCHPWPP